MKVEGDWSEGFEPPESREVTLILPLPGVCTAPQVFGQGRIPEWQTWNIGPRKANRRVRHQGPSEASDRRNCHRSRPVPSTGSSQGCTANKPKSKARRLRISASGIL